MIPGLFPASDFQLPASDFQLPTSDFQLPASNFQLPASSFQLPTSNFHLPTSIFQLFILKSYFLNVKHSLSFSETHYFHPSFLLPKTMPVTISPNSVLRKNDFVRELLRKVLTGANFHIPDAESVDSSRSPVDGSAHPMPLRQTE